MVDVPGVIPKLLIFKITCLTQHGDEIRRGLDWLLSWNAEHFKFERTVQILEQAMAIHLKNTGASHLTSASFFCVFHKLL
jgi:hypothetical protein